MNSFRFWITTLILILAPPLGFILHEGGHYFFGLLSGFELEFHHNKVVPINHKIYDLANSLSNIDYDKLNESLKKDYLFFYIGGPIVTIVVSLIGLILLKYKRNYKLAGYFMGANILREIFISLQNIFLKNSFNDEKQISYLLDLDMIFFNTVLFVFSSFIFLLIIKPFNRKELTHLLKCSAIALPLGLVIWMKFGNYLFI